MRQQWALKLQSFRNHIYYHFLGKPYIMKLSTLTNIFKGGAFFYILSLMYFLNNFSTAMYLYLAIYSFYGWCWLLKDMNFPDATLHHEITIGSAIGGTVLLLFYWGIPLPMAFGMSDNQPSIQRVVFIVSAFFLGVILVMCSDYQKTSTLRKRKGLISTGLFSRSRNPNYLGEIILYTSFAMTAGHWIGYCILFFIWSTLFVMNLYLKDRLSYQKKDGWDQYKKKSYILLPKVFQSDILNFVIYAAILVVFVHYEWNYIRPFN